MVQYCSILQESEVAVVVDNMDWSDWVLLVFLPDSHVFLPAAIVTIKIDSWAVLE